MAPMMGSEVTWPHQFEESVELLIRDFPHLWDVIEGFKETLLLGYDLPAVPVNTALYPNLYTVNLDYPPLGQDGLARFQIIYHATEPAPAPNTPYQTFTLIDLSER